MLPGVGQSGKFNISKKMKVSFLTLVSILLLASCSGRVAEKSQSSNSDSVMDDTLAIEKSAKSFYDWCFNNNFPYYEVVRGRNGKCMLDTASYFGELRKLGTLSELFIAKEKERVKGCADFMATVDYTAYEASEGYEYATQCADFYYMYWIGSQEIPNSFKIKNVKQNSKKDASADLYVNYGATDEYLVTITLQKEQNSWKITDITSVKQDEELKLTTINTKPLIEDFIPQGWRTILHESGDLNNDGIDDHVIVVEDTKLENIKTNDKLGRDTLNLNPRTVMVFFKKKNGGYILVAQNDIGFIPTENDEESTCLADPLMTEGGITIQKGVLIIGFQYWLSCGSWYVNNVDYKFRYQDKQMRLIGFDHAEFHRASGEQYSTSINFSTGKMEHMTGYNMFDDNASKPKTKTSNWKGKKTYTLDNCDAHTYFELLDI